MTTSTTTKSRHLSSESPSDVSPGWTRVSQTNSHIIPFSLGWMAGIVENQIESINRIKSNQIESINRIKSNQIESNRIESNRIESNQIESNRIKSNRIKSNQSNLFVHMLFVVLQSSFGGEQQLTYNELQKQQLHLLLYHFLLFRYLESSGNDDALLSYHKIQCYH